MEVKEIKNEGLELKCSFKVPANEIDSEVDIELTSISKTAKMQGFRPGKVPLKIIEGKYKASVESDVIRKKIETYIKNYVTENKITLATKAVIDDVEYSAGKDMVFVASFEKMPEIPATDFSKIEIVKPVLKPEDKKIDEYISKFLSTMKNFEKAAKTYKAKDGDKVIIDFEGFLGEKAFDGGKAEDFSLELGSKSFIPGFEEGLVGCKEGDDKVLELNFPETYHAKDLAGKATTFKVKVKEVQKAEKSELTDEVAQKLKFKDASDLRNFVSETLSKDLNDKSRTYQKMKLFDALDSKLTFSSPKTMVEKEKEGLLTQFKRFKDEDEDLKNKSDDQLAKEAEKIADRRVRIGLMLADHAQKNQITVSEKDYSDAVINEAKMYPGMESRVVEFYRSNPKALDNLTGTIVEEKAVDNILNSLVKIKEKDYTEADLEKAIDEIASVY
jgi:trigger factor